MKYRRKRAVSAALASLLLFASGCAYTANADEARDLAGAYVAAHYPEQAGYELKTYPNFFGNSEDVWVRAYAPDSQDLYFEFYYDSSAKRLDDHHDGGMAASLGGGHTYYRLKTEYGDLVRSAPKTQYGLSDLGVKLLTEQEGLDALWEEGTVCLDIPFSTSLPLDWELYQAATDAHEGTAAEFIRTLHAFSVDNSFVFARYAGTLEAADGGRLHFDVPAALAESQDLEARLEAALTRGTSGSTIYIA